MGIIKSSVRIGEKPPQAAIDEVMAAAKRPIAFDEDCPPTSEEEFAVLDAIIAERRAHMKKQNISLRISEKMISQVKEKVGKGYTGFLSRLLEAAIKEPELVRKCL